MKVASLELLLVSLPFRMTFRHSLAERDRGLNVLVRACDMEGHVGYGECVPREYVTGESQGSVLDLLGSSWGARFVGLEIPSFEAAVETLDGAGTGLPRDRHAAFCALELAILDLAGRAFDRSAGDVLGPVTRESVEYSGIVSADGESGIRRTLELLREMNVGDIKVKVGRDAATDLEILTEVRAVLGEQCALRIDANCAWERTEALERLGALSAVELRAAEQPLAAKDIEGLVWLTARSPVPIIVDESVVSLEDAQRLAERRACHAFNIRVSKCGGLLRSAKIYELARRENLGCMLGAQVGETAILSAAGRQVATRMADLWFLEGSYGDLLLEQDIGNADLTLGRGGRAVALRGPGLGVTINEDVLRGYVQESVFLGEGSCHFYPGSL